MGSAADDHARLAKALGRHHDQLLDGLCELEWAVDPANPHVLSRGRQKVRARAEMVLGLRQGGRGSGGWAAVGGREYGWSGELACCGRRIALHEHESKI